ncbi:Zn-dependent alcohol dehydrogenase [Streptomyces caniscabiei]|uniref:Zn-dependent alcohol dehydrogenase n=1 Tax=Streptomyces caniscabiei TaxID=2746961 RepID=A0A927L4E2_9ACTN|nr:Zn-dependent alcohol dehydrogenase [Streptomyces caniscabiei]MBD9725317.1 Zn-dependent alcohol dehydrogenase [Streptomyces caniscabiei]MDX3510867.1 Zn-dependent alcohol dehydrogenase [Streptomyces caniscabiei]MDX3720189.1 Zn-dependent alcohol dehydrogenase [Streptomyces caniscabiei]WEO29294.1 Zn-dependent alcohol dehydrogenase [Streptomyces caniscabiei]
MTALVDAAVLNAAPGRLEIEKLRLDAPGPDEVLVRVVSAGLCHSDLHEIDGTFASEPPIVLGHEASGVVEAAGADVVGLRVGDHVVTCLSVFCGRCRYCTGGRLTLCENRSRLSHQRPGPRLVNAAGRPVRPTAGIGAFAQAMVVHQNALVRIPSDMPMAPASILGCAVTTGLGAVFRGARVEPGSSVVVIGTGGIGTAAVQGARIAGATQIIAVDLIPEKLKAAERFGATHALHAGESDPVEAVRDITGGGADFAFEAVGRSTTVEQAFAMLRPGGLATVVGMVPEHTPIRVSGPELFLQEKRLQGSFMGSNQFKTDIPRYVDLYLQGRLLLDDMVSDHVTLAGINEGFELLAQGRATRVVADIGEV